MNLQEIKTAIAEGKKEIVYNDGREGHKNIKATILESDDRKMIVQFEDRADTTIIFFSEKAWMDFITINGMKTLESCLLVCLGGKKYIPCQTFAECSTAIQKYICENNFGATDFYKKRDAGYILHHVKGCIARVSYNGKVWTSHEAGKEITDLSKNDI